MDDAVERGATTETRSFFPKLFLRAQAAHICIAVAFLMDGVVRAASPDNSA